MLSDQPHPEMNVLATIHNLCMTLWMKLNGDLTVL